MLVSAIKLSPIQAFTHALYEINQELILLYLIIKGINLKIVHVRDSVHMWLHCLVLLIQEWYSTDTYTLICNKNKSWARLTNKYRSDICPDG